MDKLIAGLVMGIGFALLIGIISVFSGTIIWLIWPVAIPAAFPGLVAGGVFSAKLSWWASVCLSWLFGLLIKASQSNTNKS
ncbi:MAG: hypothetical protein WC910_10940 [Bacteroidales bacterium]|jgi:hypothetical protein